MPLSNHTSRIKIVAMRGNLVTSGSNDRSFCAWNIATSENIGNLLRFFENSVISAAINADGKLIVSGPRYKTKGCR